MNKETIAIIGSGYQGKIYADRAKMLGIETHCFSPDINTPAFGAVDYFHEIDIFDIEKIVSICVQNGVKGVLATTELTIFPAAQIAHKLGVNGNDVEVAKNITNKHFIRNKVKTLKLIHQPQYYEVSDIANYVDIEFPVIVKPIAAGGKRGVSVAYNEMQLEIALKDAFKYSRIQGALIEEYLDGGIEYSVESLSYMGEHYILQITQKDSSGPPHCVELGHHQPAELSEIMRVKVKEAIKELLTAVGIENGPCHTEIKIINEKIFLIEINGRPGGDHINYPLTELSTGYPYITGIIMVALNQFKPSELENLKNYYCGVCFATDLNPKMQDVLNTCADKDWLYEKHIVSEEPSKIRFNNGTQMNYFIYFSKNEKPEL